MLSAVVFPASSFCIASMCSGTARSRSCSTCSIDDTRPDLKKWLIWSSSMDAFWRVRHAFLLSLPSCDRQRQSAEIQHGFVLSTMIAMCRWQAKIPSTT